MLIIFPGIGIPIAKRLLWGRLIIIITRIPILERWHLFGSSILVCLYICTSIIRQEFYAVCFVEIFGDRSRWSQRSQLDLDTTEHPYEHKSMIVVYRYSYDMHTFCDRSQWSQDPFFSAPRHFVTVHGGHRHFITMSWPVMETFFRTQTFCDRSQPSRDTSEIRCGHFIDMSRLVTEIFLRVTAVTGIFFCTQTFVTCHSINSRHGTLQYFTEVQSIKKLISASLLFDRFMKGCQDQSP